MLDFTALADHVLEAWKAADIRQHVSDNPLGVPDRPDIEVLLNIAFFSSIQKEEGNFVTFSLMYLQTHKDAQPRHSLTEFNRFLSFDEPIELSVKAVGKLAGAIDERTSVLVVEKRKDQHVITGIAPFGQQSTRLSVSQGGFPRPDALTVAARAPGSLLISRGHGNLGRYAAGEFEPAQVSPFHSRALGADLIQRISEHPAFVKFGNQYWHWYRDALEHLLRSSSERGHGGSIVWVPRQAAPTALGQVRLGNKTPHFTAIYDTFSDLISRSIEHDEHLRSSDAGDANHSRTALGLTGILPAAKRKVITLFDMLAQIACIDGATLIDDYFSPLTFGARLSAPEWNGPIYSGPNISIKQGSIARARFGTRHNSAIDFVAAVPGTIAFVLSEDGPVRAITRRHDTVYLWPDCLNTMFVD